MSQQTPVDQLSEEAVGLLKGQYRSTEDSQHYYHLGASIRACLSALRGAMTMDCSAQEKENSRSTRETFFSDWSYERWVNALWNNLPATSKVGGANHEEVLQFMRNNNQRAQSSFEVQC